MAYFPFLLLGPFVISLFVKYIQHLLSLPIHPLITLVISTKELTQCRLLFTVLFTYLNRQSSNDPGTLHTINNILNIKVFHYPNKVSVKYSWIYISFLIPLNHVCTARVEMLILSIVGFQYLICLDHYSYISQI